MPVIRVKSVENEASVDQLLSEFYPGLSLDELERVRDITLEANSHLSLEGNLMPGTFILLPDHISLSADIGTVNSAHWVHQLAQSLGSSVGNLEGELDNARHELNGSLSLVGSAAGNTKQTILLERLKDDLNKEIKANEAALALMKSEVGTLQNDLNTLIKNLR